MSLGNPLALIGLLGIAVPLVIHLFGRQRARRQRFPTLRFLVTSRLMPTRRRRLTDLVLLAVRICIIVSAAFALTQPRFSRDEAATPRDVIIARAIVVDTSASMTQMGLDGTPAVRAARREGVRLAAEAPLGTTIETAVPASAIVGAAAWLDRRPGMRELVVVSDFQLGTLDSAAVASIPASVGVKLLQIGVAPRVSDRIRVGNRFARVAATAGRTEVEWAAIARSIPPSSPHLFAGGPERPRADAAMAAAIATAGSAFADSTKPVAIIYREYEGRSALVQSAQRLGRPWMGDAIARLHANPALVEAAANADVSADTSTVGAQFTVVARTAAGLPVVLASQGPPESADRLDLWMLADAGSLTSAALIAAIDAATSAAPPAGEIEPEVLSVEQLHRWERPAGTAGPPPAGSESDASWFWAASLLLLGVEQVLRAIWRKGLSPSHRRSRSSGQADSPRQPNGAVEEQAA